WPSWASKRPPTGTRADHAAAGAGPRRPFSPGWETWAMIDIVYRFDPAAPPPAPPATSAEARERLCAGNRAFSGLLDLPDGAASPTRVSPFDLSDVGIGDTAGKAPRQRPFAVVLGCSDARVPTELIFNEACNALFVVRVAGNVLGSECLGSIDYAVQHL